MSGPRFELEDAGAAVSMIAGLTSSGVLRMSSDVRYAVHSYEKILSEESFVSRKPPMRIAGVKRELKRIDDLSSRLNVEKYRIPLAECLRGCSDETLMYMDVDPEFRDIEDDCHADGNLQNWMRSLRRNENVYIVTREIRKKARQGLSLFRAQNDEFDELIEVDEGGPNSKFHHLSILIFKLARIYNQYTGLNPTHGWVEMENAYPQEFSRFVFCICEVVVPDISTSSLSKYIHQGIREFKELSLDF